MQPSGFPHEQREGLPHDPPLGPSTVAQITQAHGSLEVVCVGSLGWERQPGSFSTENLPLQSGRGQGCPHKGWRDAGEEPPQVLENPPSGKKSLALSWGQTSNRLQQRIEPRPGRVLFVEQMMEAGPIRGFGCEFSQLPSRRSVGASPGAHPAFLSARRSCCFRAASSRSDMGGRGQAGSTQWAKRR